MARKILDEIIASDWDESKEQQRKGNPRTRWLQTLHDIVHRPLNNRGTVLTSATAIACNGATQSSGIGLAQLQPIRYGEFTVKARVTFNINSTGPAYVYVMRTTGAIPANGAAPNGGDVIVGGDAFVGGATVSGVNQAGALSYIDTGLDTKKNYRYYLAVKGPNATTLNLVNSSQVFVFERS